MNIKEWLSVKLERPTERTLVRKALTLIEEITVESDNAGDGQIYKIAHAALGRCGNPHDDWKEEILKNYHAIRRDELRRRRQASDE